MGLEFREEIIYKRIVEAVIFILVNAKFEVKMLGFDNKKNNGLMRKILMYFFGICFFK